MVKWDLVKNIKNKNGKRLCDCWTITETTNKLTNFDY